MFAILIILEDRLDPLTGNIVPETVHSGRTLGPFLKIEHFGNSPPLITNLRGEQENENRIDFTDKEIPGRDPRRKFYQLSDGTIWSHLEVIPISMNDPSPRRR